MSAKYTPIVVRLTINSAEEEAAIVRILDAACKHSGAQIAPAVAYLMAKLQAAKQAAQALEKEVSEGPKLTANGHHPNPYRDSPVANYENGA